MTRLVTTVCFVVLAVAAIATTDPTGKWIGKLIKGPDAQSAPNATLLRTEASTFKQDFSKARYSLELKADHTFSRTLRRGKFTSVSTGTWSVEGLTVTVATSTISGSKIKPQSSLFVLTADGKTLTYRQSNGVTLQYKRA